VGYSAAVSRGPAAVPWWSRDRHGVDRAGPAERELRRLGRRCAAVARAAMAVAAAVLVVFVPAGPVVGVVVALAVWGAGGFLPLSRIPGGWLVVADAAAVTLACLTQRWTVPPDALHGNTSWVWAVASIAVAAWQWHSGVGAGAVATAAVIVAYLAGSGVGPTPLLVAFWLAVEAVLSRGLYHLVRAGARETDRIMAHAEQARRAAAVATARRADERAHLAAIHDTAAAIFQAIGAGVVTGREPWLANQLADAIDEVAGDAATPAGGSADLACLLDDVVRASPVTAELSVADPAPRVPVPVAVAVCRAVREALLNVARHAGVNEAAVRLEHRPTGVLVEITDHGAGFDPAEVPPHRRGITLSLVDRMATVGGRAGVTSCAGRGTRVRLEWPDG
jgi:histidine kinase/DNA gyrase B/HSP90-like ATPase